MTWLTLTAERPPDAWAAAEIGDGGWLAVSATETPGALRADPAAFDPSGPATTASLLLLDRDVLFDDTAVQRARQLVLAGGPWTAVTTFVDDPVHFRGSLLAGGGDDPFGLVGTPRRIQVGAGLLSPGPLRLPSPIVERYAGQPWPQAGF